MRRLRISGAAVATPRLGEAKLREALILLGVGGYYDDGGVHEIHLRIAEIIGLWFAEQEAKEASPVAKALLSTGRNLLEASKVLSGHQTGERALVEIQATTEAVRLLALDPTIGPIDTAKTFVENFHEQSAKIGHACLVAWADLAEEGGLKGRPALHWYDEVGVWGFDARMHLRIADEAPVNPERISEFASSRVGQGKVPNWTPTD
jgi:hypothetical protein